MDKREELIFVMRYKAKSNACGRRCVWFRRDVRRGAGQSGAVPLPAKLRTCVVVRGQRNKRLVSEAGIVMW
jgi:hypothetical protein